MARESIDERRARLTPGAHWLRTERERRGWTGGELAQRLGIHQTRISAYERAQDEPPSEVARGLAEVFGLTELEVWQHLHKPLPRELTIEGMSDEEVIAYVRRRFPGRLDDLVAEPNATSGGRPDAPTRRERTKKVTRPDEPGRSASR